MNYENVIKMFGSMFFIFFVIFYIFLRKVKDGIIRTAEKVGFQISPPECFTCGMQELDSSIKSFNERGFQMFFYLDFKANKSHGKLINFTTIF